MTKLRKRRIPTGPLSLQRSVALSSSSMVRGEPSCCDKGPFMAATAQLPGLTHFLAQHTQGDEAAQGPPTPSPATLPYHFLPETKICIMVFFSFSVRCAFHVLHVRISIFLCQSNASFFSPPQPTDDAHGEAPQLCSFDRSLHFIRQHRTRYVVPRFFFIVVELHHRPTTSRVSSLTLLSKNHQSQYGSLQYRQHGRTSTQWS